MFRYPHISLTEAERALIVRTVEGSELELKFGYGGQTGLPEALYASIVSRLERHARKEEPVTYTNTMWPAENGTYRKTSGPEGDVYIKKVRLSRPETTFQAEFAWFTLKCSEAEELPIRPLPLPDAVTTRRITRTRFSAPITIGSASIDLVYECSVVQTSKGGGTSRSFEIEMELPEIAETPDAAISGVSYLLAAFYEPYGVPPSFLVPKYEEMQRAIETVNESTSSRSRDSFRFRSNPVNLKREEIGRLDEFAMTNKLDGERKVVVSHPSGVWVFHPSGWIPGKIQSCYLLADRSHLPFFVLDTEYYEGRFHVFDVIQWGLSPKHQFMAVEGHEKRMNQLSPHLVDLERLHLVRKKFYYGSFRENIGAFMAANDPGQWYDHNDGLIFTPKNGTWAKPPSLKYKFPAKLSIDFRLRLLGEHHHQNVYELGVAKYERGEKAIVPLDGMTLTTFRVIRQPIIGECVFSHEDRRWIVLRDRTDKTDPNEIKVAGNVHDDIRNPITFAELAGGVDATIAEREAGFLYESAKKEQRLFAMGFDLLRTKLVGNLMAFYRNSDEKTGRDLDERLFHFFHQPYSLDFDIMHYLTEKMGDRYTVYGDLREVALLQTILGKRGVREVFDGRTQMVVNASALAQLSGVSYRHPLARMIIPGDEMPNPMSVVRFPELGSVLSGWFPELRRMAIMKAHGIEELSAWRAWFAHAAIDAYENEEVRCRRMGVHPADSVFLAQYWEERKYEMVFLSAIPRSDSRELYLHSPAMAPVRERSVLNVTTRLLGRGICHTVVALVPDGYPIEKFGPAVYVEVKQLGGARILRISASNPAPAMTEKPVSLWSLPYVDRYDRLFTLTTGQRDVVVRVPKKRTPEMMAAVQMNYHLTPFTVLPWKLIQRDALEAEAVRSGYRRTEIVPAEDWDAVWYSKAQEQPNVQRIQEQRIQEQRIQEQPNGPRIQEAPNVQRIQEQPNGPRIQEAPKAKGKEDDRGPMRKYHNSQKAVLIRTYCKSRRVLDLGAGYGGDLFKYAEADVTSLVLVEPNETNIRSREEVEGTDGLERRLAMSTLRDRSVIVPTVGQDTDRIMEALLPARAGVVASFFSMTFLFESSSILGSFLDTVDFGLVEGGYFIGTMMEGEKAFEAFRGAKEHRYGKATIVKHYDDADPPAIGMPLWINIDGTIVKNQNEYLAFFSILKEEMERREFVLEWKFDFRPETYFDPIDESDQAFSRLNIGFVFRKMPRRIPNVVRPNLPDTSQEFINLYGDEQVLLRTGVDGNHTFLRSYLYNTSHAYRRIMVAAAVDRTRMVKALAEEIAGLFDDEAMKEAIRKGEASEEHIIRLMEKRDVNIYLLDGETRRPVNLGPYHVPRRNSVVVMRKKEGAKVWYEPVGFLSNGYAKRILRPFDANLIKLHRTIAI